MWLFFCYKIWNFVLKMRLFFFWGNFSLAFWGVFFSLMCLVFWLWNLKMRLFFEEGFLKEGFFFNVVGFFGMRFEILSSKWLFFRFLLAFLRSILFNWLVFCWLWNLKSFPQNATFWRGFSCLKEGFSLMWLGFLLCNLLRTCWSVPCLGRTKWLLGRVAPLASSPHLGTRRDESCGVWGRAVIGVQATQLCPLRRWRQPKRSSSLSPWASK